MVSMESVIVDILLILSPVGFLLSILSKDSLTQGIFGLIFGIMMCLFGLEMRNIAGLEDSAFLILMMGGILTILNMLNLALTFKKNI